MAEIRVQRKKGIPLIWLLLALIILVLAIWFLADRMGGDENAGLATPEGVEEFALLGRACPRALWPEPAHPA